MSTLVVKQIELGPMQNFVYLIGDREKKVGVVVDPAWDVEAILAAAAEAELRIVGALVTHTHPDHVNGLKELVEKTDCKVHVHTQEKGRLPDLKENLVRTEGGHELSVGDLTVRFIHTPGHTPGSQCFHVQDRLVSGDTLFIDHCGRCDFPESDPLQMYQSLHRTLKAIPDSTTLYPGHNYADREPITQSSLGEERKHNKYLLARNLEEFLLKRMGPDYKAPTAA